jgi:hypothetical protein
VFGEEPSTQPLEVRGMDDPKRREQPHPPSEEAAVVTLTPFRGVPASDAIKDIPCSFMLLSSLHGQGVEGRGHLRGKTGKEGASLACAFKRDMGIFFV